MRLLRRIQGDESGVALVVAMGAMLVIGMLAVAVADGAARLSAASNRDNYGARALAAAQSGLSVATQRLTNATPRPPDNQCFTTVAIAPSGAGCAWTSPESIVGNNSQLRYRVSPVITNAASDTCAALPVPIPYGYKQRCVTASATVSGQTRVVQRRIVQNLGASYLPFVGALGIDGVSLNQSHARGILASNHNVTLGAQSGVTDPGDIRLGTRPNGSPGTLTLSGGTHSGTVTSGLPTFVLDPLDGLYSAAVDANQTSSLSLPSGVTLNSGNLDVGPGRVVTLQSGATYSFCSIILRANARLVLPGSATSPARIFVDSSYRPGSPNYTPSTCSARTGSTPVVSIASGAGFQNDTNKASLLQLFVYGGATTGIPAYDITFNASADFTGTIYAPRAHVLFNSGGNITGALAVSRITYNNNNQRGNLGFQPDPDAANVTGLWDGTWLRKAWRDCPASGCPAGAGP